MMRTRRCFTFAAAAALLMIAPASLACGVCIEDKIAVTYDHAVVMRATARRQVVVFAAVESTADAARVARDVSAAAARVSGIDRDSVRIAASPSALSFALDPGVASPEQALAAIARTARVPVRLSVLRVVR